ncbi:hypothetical protein [Serratia fonticola]|uniref:hypothetical protein n=1 Tax=Serratia fonticola TaxID=47917 RepID=UPI0016451BEA|nr:hypothetical protein [Serratia fonticola]MBC3250472.1 hypothetical protein [Serratia fonticola]
MSENIDSKYADKLQELCEEMRAAGGDPENMIMSWVSGYVQAATEDDPEVGLIWQFEDVAMVISLEPVDEDIEPGARVH